MRVGEHPHQASVTFAVHGVRYYHRRRFRLRASWGYERHGRARTEASSSRTPRPPTREDNVGEHPGRDFHRATRHTPESVRGHRLDWSTRPSSFKTYAGVPTVRLPDPDPGRQAPPLWDTILRRRSVRSFSKGGLSLDELSHLLWASAGITRVAPNHLYRAAPSAGGLNPIETYVAIRDAQGVPAGIYHYRVAAREVRDGVEHLDPADGHALELVREGDVSLRLAEGALQQALVAQAPVVFVWTAVFERSRWKYRERAYRYVYLDAGHIAAHLSLAAVALGLGSCQIGAFFDSTIDGILGVDGETEATLYMTAVGNPAGPPR
ncbi:MAG: SagB/ThcOx family dehydrogenase [Thermoleophilia bacterium]